MMYMMDVAARTGSDVGWAGGPGPWWILFPLLWVALIVTVVWLLARRRPERGRSASEAAIGILAARYARGEIDTDEYRRRLDEVRGLS